MHVKAGQIDSSSSSKKKTTGVRPEAQPYKEGKYFAIRKHYKGHEIYVSGCASAAAARKILNGNQAGRHTYEAGAIVGHHLRATCSVA